MSTRKKSAAKKTASLKERYIVLELDQDHQDILLMEDAPESTYIFHNRKAAEDYLHTQAQTNRYLYGIFKLVALTRLPEDVTIIDV